LFVSRRRTLFFGLGGAAFVVGIALLSLGVYSALNSDNGPPVSDAPVVRVRDILTPTATPAVATTTRIPTPTPLPPFGNEAYTMVIDRIGVDAPVETFGLDANQVPEVPTGPGQGPGKIVAWYNFSAKPGTGSNAVFAGHVTWNGAAVFYRLTELTLGDEITLHGVDGTELTYKISDVFRVLSTDPDARVLMFGTPQDIMTILTCDGVFTKDPNNHVTGGDYDHRLVIRADLESVTHPTGAPGAG
jgi:LPXTG-site transpeptidase (sortase) family protein